MKASEVGDWLRQRAGKRNHREVLSGDYLVLRPGPNFNLLNPMRAQPMSLAAEQGQPRDDRREAGDRGP